MQKIIRKKFLMLPLILVEVYLIFTLLLYQFGPLDWQTENVGMFWSFLILYHLAFIVGYVFSVKKINIRKAQWGLDNICDKKLSFIIWIIILICIVCACIEYKNLTHASSYIPYELPKNFINGLINPAEQYYNKFVTSEGYVSNKMVTVVSAAFSFIYVSIIPFLIVKWKKINIAQKICFFGLIFFKMAIYVSVGTNKGIFDTMFAFAGIVAILLMLNVYHGNEENIDKKTLLKVSILAIALVVFSFAYFTINISSRVASPVEYAKRVAEPNKVEENQESEVVEEQESIGETEKINDMNIEEVSDVEGTEEVVIEEEVVEETEVVQEESKPDGFVKRMYYSVSNYLTQGYYGFSLALDEEFTTTYGIGNSQFLSSNFKSIFGIDVQDRTYQHKITEEWDEFEQWHSFYSYIANDISFVGVIFFMLILGLYYGCICKDVILNGSLIGKLLLSIFIILFMYMPANNQVFTSMATFCGFFELTFFWIVTKFRFIKGKQ